MNNVADGIAHITGRSLQELNALAESVLSSFKHTLESNTPKKSC